MLFVFLSLSLFNVFLVSLVMWIIFIIFYVAHIYLVILFSFFRRTLSNTWKSHYRQLQVLIMIFNKKALVSISSISNSKNPPWNFLGFVSKIVVNECLKTMCGIVFKCVIVWKPSSHIGLPIIRNQSKTTAILQTFFFWDINNNSRYKTQKVSWWVFLTWRC